MRSQRRAMQLSRSRPAPRIRHCICLLTPLSLSLSLPHPPSLSIYLFLMYFIRSFVVVRFCCVGCCGGGFFLLASLAPPSDSLPITDTPTAEERGEEICADRYWQRVIRVESPHTIVPIHYTNTAFQVGGIDTTAPNNLHSTQFNSISIS